MPKSLKLAGYEEEVTSKHLTSTGDRSPIGEPKSNKSCHFKYFYKYFVFSLGFLLKRRLSLIWVGGGRRRDPKGFPPDTRLSTSKVICSFNIPEQLHHVDQKIWHIGAIQSLGTDFCKSERHPQSCRGENSENLKGGGGEKQKETVKFSQNIDLAILTTPKYLDAEISGASFGLPRQPQRMLLLSLILLGDKEDLF